jgi:hypothetical protein
LFDVPEVSSVGAKSMLSKNREKMAPLLGPRFKRLRIWWVMSGKAIQDAVPPAGTVREVTRRKSEGHGAEFAASLLPRKSAFAAPK